ncbi:MAG: TetR family transcriptional regulator [Hamadaea sp.]|uniref:TetR/AcrR family transcriptional regulator n=1 Tax=Hamadaea sp. TaxID=2024425 RepID=UPI001848120B|nr:TetR/AcrR family transcriptional regulator C-terminal domain-containing protein [Hamadaea sp.]NUR69421.1 TetR family transcriptional regulator [Hamadaea sp.]NUT23836.1 TetR family transcriptional regulator [Hamadaea sp.]
MASEKSQLLWSRPAGRPKVTREQIATTALAIADAEGFEAATMRRIAADLGAGTMTLYHYVRSKAELKALMLDAIMAEQLVPPGELPTDWRGALTALAYRTRAMFRRHPWALTGLAEAAGAGGGGAGPHALLHFEQSLAAVASTGLPPQDRMDLISAVDEYVAGFVLKTDLEPGLESVPAEATPQATAYLDGLLSTGDYPHVAELLGDGDRWAALVRLGNAYSPDERFDRGLRRLFDGVAAQIAAQPGERSSRRSA